VTRGTVSPAFSASCARSSARFEANENRVLPGGVATGVDQPPSDRVAEPGGGQKRDVVRRSARSQLVPEIGRGPEGRGGRSRPWRLALAFAAIVAGAGAVRRMRRSGGARPDASSSAVPAGGATDDQPVPEADALEQQRDVVPAGDEVRVSSDPEAPQPDALDQARSVGAAPMVDAPSRDPEVPEADALDQALELLPPEEER
jgi:hypothetical protein